MSNLKNQTNNLAIYEQVREVPKEAQKSFNNGRFSGTDINPMWRIKKLTEVFGPCGFGWYVKVTNREIVKSGDTECTFVGVELYVKQNGEWSAPIYGEGGNTFSSVNKYGNVSVSDEAYKMAYTDALSNAAKMLGVGADIWFANDKEHSTKYDLQQERNKEQAKPQAPAQPATDDAFSKYEESMKNAKTNDEVNALWSGLSAELQADERYKAVCINKCKELKNHAA